MCPTFGDGIRAGDRPHGTLRMCNRYLPPVSELGRPSRAPLDQNRPYSHTLLAVTKRPFRGRRRPSSRTTVRSRASLHAPWGAESRLPRPWDIEPTLVACHKHALTTWVDYTAHLLQVQHRPRAHDGRIGVRPPRALASRCREGAPLLIVIAIGRSSLPRASTSARARQRVDTRTCTHERKAASQSSRRSEEMVNWGGESWLTRCAAEPSVGVWSKAPPPIPGR